MRTSTAEERALSLSPDAVGHVKIEIQDADGSWRDWSDRNAGGRIGAHRDRIEMSATVRLHAGLGEDSIAPLVAVSLHNRSAAGAYAPAIDGSRLIRIWTATLQAGMPVASGDYRAGFEGRINRVDHDGEEVLELSCSGKAIFIAQRQIREAATYGAPGGTLREVVIQQLLDANPNGKWAPALLVPVASGSYLTPFDIPMGMTGEAVRQLALDIGWDVRERFDANGVLQLMFVAVDRARVSVDAVIQVHERIRLGRLTLEVEPIRTSGRLWYRNAAGVLAYVEYENAAAIDDHGDRWFQIPEQAALRTATEAQAAINAAGHDMSGPGAEFAATLPFCWWMEIHDRYTFKGEPLNASHHDTDQTIAVASVDHVWDEQGEFTTQLTGTARIVGAYEAWHNRLVPPTPATTAPGLRFRAMVQPDRTVNIFARLQSAKPVHFPVTLDVYENDPAGAALYSYTFLASNGSEQEVGPTGAVGMVATSALLTGRPIGHASTGKRWYAKTTDGHGNVDWQFAMADENAHPSGSVVPGDYRANPELVIQYDDDTSSVKVICPDGQVKTFGPLPLGSGTVTYIRGGTPRDNASLEAALTPDQVTGAYIVYAANAEIPAGVELWSGVLHGVPAAGPTIEPRVTVAANKATADGWAAVRSPRGEQITLRFKESEALSPVVWTLCLGAADPTTRYVASGTEIGPADWFTNGAGVQAQKLAVVPLVRDAIVRRYLQAIAKDSALESTWTVLAFDQRGVPWIESIDLVFDEATDQLKLTAVAGANTVSTRIELADEPTFAAPLENVVSAHADGVALQHTTAALTAVQRNKVWYARVTPYNAAAAGGLAGVPQRDTVSVPASDAGGISAPKAWLDEADNTDVDVDFLLRANLGAGATGPLEWQTIEWADLTPEPAWPGVWQATALPQTKTVTRAPKWGTHLKFRVRDAAGRTTEATPGYVSARNPFVNDAGAPKRGHPYDDGGYGTRATDAGGVVLHASVVETGGGGKLVSRLYAKPLAADPDDADSVGDGLARRTASVNYVDGFGRPTIVYDTAQDVNRTGTQLNDAYGRSVTAIADQAGTLASVAKESGAKPINRLFAKPLAADPDNADSVGNGLTRRVTTLNEATGAARAYPAIDAGGVLVATAVDLARGYTNKHAGNIPRTASDSTPVADLTSRLTSTGHAGSTMTETGGGGKLLNRLFAKPLAGDPDNADSVGAGLVRAPVAVGYLDASLRPKKLIRAAGDSDISADLIAANFAEAPDSMIVNGGAQSTTTGANLDGWVQNSGQAFQATTAQAVRGDRSIRCIHAVAGASTAYQDFGAVSAGLVYELGLWVKPSSWVGAGGVSGAVLAVVGQEANDGAWTILAKIADPHVSTGRYAGAVLSNAAADAVGWVFVKVIARCNVSGTGRCYLVHGFGATVSGTAYFDGLYVRKVDDATISVGGARGKIGLTDTGEVALNLPASLGQHDGVSVRVLAKGHVSGSCRHGDVVNFPTNFQNVPMVLIRGGITYEPRAKWGTTGDGTETGASNYTTAAHREDVAALNLTASGFTMRARLRQRATPTLREHYFPANSLTAVGHTVDRNLDNAPANNDTYTALYSVDVTANAGVGSPNSVTLTVAIEVDKGDGLGFIERATRTYSVQAAVGVANTDSWIREAVSVVVSGLDATDDIRIKIKSFTTGTAAGSFTVHGFASGDAEYGVTYQTGSDTYASKTPEADDRVYWEAIEVA